jgi:CDP-6-deoxy-D-xylo-4-hexulose-3-dehydrase
MVSSGSAANLVLIQSLLNLKRLKNGDRVGFSILTWPTNVMPLIQLGLKPEPIDCEIKTLNVSPATLRPYLKKIKALFITNVLGFCDRLDRIRDLCKKENILLIEDNCEALGSKMAIRRLGNFGLASTFSFYVAHHLSTIEGGMICTDDKDLHNMAVMVRAHGWDRNLPAAEKRNIRLKYKVNDFYDKYTFYDLAYNARPTEINGFLGNVQLKYLDEIIENRAKNFQIFNQIIQSNHDLIPLDVQHMAVVSNFAMPVVCKNKKLFDKYRHLFEKNEIEIRPIIAGDMTRQPFYKKYMEKVGLYPNTKFIHNNGFYFGNNPEMTKKEITFICKLLKSK